MSLISLSLILALNAAAAPAAKTPACHPQKVEKKAPLKFPDGKIISANVVDTPLSREIGMMCLTKLKSDYGMLFVFPQEMGLNFWMKNTLVSLDIVWIGADKRVTVVHDHLKKSTVDALDKDVATAFGRGQYVLELPAGTAAKRGLKPGSQLDFDVSIPQS